MRRCMEMTFFKLLKTGEVKEFELCSKDFQDFVSKQEGFISRNLVLDEEGRYGDIVVWESLDCAKKIEDAMMHSSEALSYMKFIDMSTIDMKHADIIEEE